MSDRIREAAGVVERVLWDDMRLTSASTAKGIAQALADASLLATEVDRRLEWLDGQGYVHTATRYVTRWEEVAHG